MNAVMIATRTLLLHDNSSRTFAKSNHVCLNALAGGKTLSNQRTTQPTPPNQQSPKCHGSCSLPCPARVRESCLSGLQKCGMSLRQWHTAVRSRRFVRSFQCQDVLKSSICNMTESDLANCQHSPDWTLSRRTMECSCEVHKLHSDPLDSMHAACHNIHIGTPLGTSLGTGHPAIAFSVRQRKAILRRSFQVR